MAHYPTAQNEQVVAIREAAQDLGKIKEETGEEKMRAHDLCLLPTSLAALTDQFREGKPHLHLKFNLTKSYKQDASPNYTQRYGNLRHT